MWTPSLEDASRIRDPGTTCFPSNPAIGRIAHKGKYLVRLSNRTGLRVEVPYTFVPRATPQGDDIYLHRNAQAVGRCG